MTAQRNDPGFDDDVPGGELVRFPASPLGYEDDLEPEPDDDEDGDELPPAAQLVPAGTAPERIALDGRNLDAMLGRPEPRPLVPEWMLDRTERRKVIRWYRKHWTHTLAWHALRIPAFLARTLAYTPRGLYRAVTGYLRWALERQAVELRQDLVARGDVNGYIALNRQTDMRRKVRLYASGGAALAAVVLAKLGYQWWAPAPAVAGALLVALLGWHGRPKDRPWIEPSVDIPTTYRRLTPDLVVQAFTAAGLCKENNPIRFVPPGIAKDGLGHQVVIDLPLGVPAGKAMVKTLEVAAGLDVDESQVFITPVKGSARRIQLWLANEDPYAKKPPVTPLAAMESIDFWKPWPFGIDARGVVVNFCLIWTSLIVGAKPRMGKTFAARLVAAAAALDPHVLLYIFNGKGDRAWKPFKDVAHRYGSGIRWSVVEHLIDCLEELVAEMNRRNEYMESLDDDRCPEDKLTPELCRDGMPLIVVCVDEIQRYLEMDQGLPKSPGVVRRGERIVALLTDLVKVGPSAGIMVVAATQRPSADTFPDSLRAQFGARFALKVMNRQASEMILGSGSLSQGFDASKLHTSHLGVGILLGGEDSPMAADGGQTVRTYLMDQRAMRGIVKRGRELRIKAGTLTGVAAGEDPIAERPAANLLDQVLDVFEAGEAQLWNETVIERLAAKNPETYDGWTPTELTKALGQRGVDAGKQVWGHDSAGNAYNRRGVTRESVLAALTNKRPGGA